jgi:ketosteroid isomerase-like protein
MPHEHPNARLIREFHDAQNRFYAGGDQGPVRAMLTHDVSWHVPGRSVIAGDYRGLEEVLRYFVRRRELAHSTFRIVVCGVLADDDGAAILAEGEMRRGFEALTWRTAVAFRITQGRIAECWAHPYDQPTFDAAWSSPADDRPAP